LSLFGSALRGALRPESDVDVLVSFQEGAEPTLFEFSWLARQLGELLGREVDVLIRRGVDQSRIPCRRREILETAETFYARDAMPFTISATLGGWCCTSKTRLRSSHAGP
jgi:predicted nucleotidyltransferase